MSTLDLTCRESTWTTTDRRTLDAVSWRQLLRNEIPLVVIPNFATFEECARLADCANRIGFEPYENVDPPIDRIGITVFEYEGRGVGEYFRDAYKARLVQQAIFSESFDPLARLIARLAAVADGPVDVATDPLFGRYHAGLVRRIEQGTLLHIDFAPAEQPAWHVARVHTQMTWNLYLELAPGDAGATRIYNRQWLPSDEIMKVPKTYGYRREVVAGAQEFTYEPIVGDVCLFNTRNFHEVEPSTGRRVTCCSAIGVLDDGGTVLWS
jgi:hypothetical protein